MRTGDSSGSRALALQTARIRIPGCSKPGTIAPGTEELRDLAATGAQGSHTSNLLLWPRAPSAQQTVETGSRKDSKLNTHARGVNVATRALCALDGPGFDRICSWRVGEALVEACAVETGLTVAPRRSLRKGFGAGRELVLLCGHSADAASSGNPNKCGVQTHCRRPLQAAVANLA